MFEARFTHGKRGSNSCLLVVITNRSSHATVSPYHWSRCQSRRTAYQIRFCDGVSQLKSPFRRSAKSFVPRSQTAEQVHDWIARHVANGPKPPVLRPFNYMKLIVITTMLLGGVSFFSLASPYIIPVVQNRNLWAAVSLIIILLFTSGHMFNHIRKVPYVSGDGKGGISYFAGGFSNQFGMETQIVAAMCKFLSSLGSCPANTPRDGVLSFATIALAVKAPRIADPKQQQVAVMIWGAVMFLMYSFLLSIFKIKNGGYPFHLPPF